MNQIAKHSHIDSLPAAYQPFVLLRVGEPPIKSLEQYIAKSKLAEILVKAAFDMGSPMADDATILQFQTQALLLEFKGKYADLTIKEVQEAFNRGIRGEFGLYFGMCPKTYNQFIKNYYELPERSKAWIEYITMLEGAKTSLAPVYFTPEKLKEFAISDFENYKASGKLPFCPHATYNVICEAIGNEIEVNGKKIKTLVVDRQIARDLFLKAKEEYLKPILENQRRKKILDVDFILQSNLNTAFEFKLKKHYLIYFFDELIKNNKPLF